MFNCGADCVFRCLPISEAVLSESFVKTDTNCFIKMFALFLASVSKFPLDSNGAIPILYYLSYLQ